MVTEDILKLHAKDIECSAKVVAWTVRKMSKNKVNPRSVEELIDTFKRLISSQMINAGYTPYYAASNLITSILRDKESDLLAETEAEYYEKHKEQQ